MLRINQYYYNIFFRYLIITLSFNYVLNKANNQNYSNDKTIYTNLTAYHISKNFVPIFLSDSINSNNNGAIMQQSSLSSSTLPLSNAMKNNNITIFNNEIFLKQQQQTSKNINQVPKMKMINIITSSSSLPPLITTTNMNVDNNNDNDDNNVIYKNSIDSLKNPLLSINVIHNNSNNNNNNNGFLLNKMNEFIKNFDIKLKNTRNIELGVTYIQQILDTMDFTATVHNDNETITKITKHISMKVLKFLNSINHLGNEIEKNITNEQIIHNLTDIELNNELFLNTIIKPCPLLDYTLEHNYNKNKIEIKNYSKYNKIMKNSNNNNHISFKINSKIMYEFNKMVENLNNIYYKNIYYLSYNDYSNDQLCQYYFNDQKFHYLYVSSIKQKHVILLIDNGNAFNDEQFELTRNFVINIIQLLNDYDYLTIITVSNDVIPIKLKSDKSVNSLYMYSCYLDNRIEFINYIEKLTYKKKSITNHTIGFEYIFKLLKLHNLNENDPIEFLYVTRGLLTHLDDTRNVLLAISNGQKLLKFPIIINTCAIIIDEKRIMYEKQFLSDISNQNYSKYNINVNDWYNNNLLRKNYNLTGNMFIITKRNPERLIQTSFAIFKNLFQNNNYVNNEIKFHLPVLDYNTKDYIISIIKPLKNYGIIGINMHLNDLLEDIIYYKKFNDSYAFITNLDGIVIYHPAYLRPIAAAAASTTTSSSSTILNNDFPVDIGYLENSNTKNFYKIRKRILSEHKGYIHTLLSSQSNNNNNNNNEMISYTWEWVLNAYVVCIVTIGNKKPDIQFSWYSKDTMYYHYQQRNTFLSMDLLYHRIDLIPPQKPSSLCRNFRQIATLDSETVFLSASSFQSPFSYLKYNKECDQETRIHNSKSIMAYIKDVTNLLANPGLLPTIRNDVIALYSTMSYLKKQHQENNLMKKYIIRRYLATMNGVVLLYPGSVLGIDMEPTRRPWFRKAMKFPGKIVLTEPYLDAGGAGYIVTIAHTIFEGRMNALHNAERDRPIAIVAIDVPYGFTYKIVLDSSGFCSEHNIKCIIIEDEGYIIAHPSILEPVTNLKNNRRPLEHITHKEPFVANDMLNHKQLVIKKLCASYQYHKVQRYYEFNTSLMETLTNVVYGERIRYQIKAIHGTNLFAIILNTTCNDGAFCPCSTVDRVCLNCNRMDQTDCECPCECPLRIKPDTYDVQSHNSSTVENIIPYCEPPSENFETVNSLSYDWNTVLKSCSNINCDLYATQRLCLGVMGCEWCQIDVDGNPFVTPFCTTQNSCFNGVLGSPTPYGDGELGSAVTESIIPSAYSAIGPVGGAIIALCLVVGFAMYCYRQNLDNISDQFYGDSVQEENFGLQLSRFNYDDALPPHEDSDLSGSGTHGNVGNGLRNLRGSLTNSIAITSISPYHMSAGGYKKPNGESDHGYSTMTPHEDSENMCFTLVEPLINNDNGNNNKRRNSLSVDSISIHTSSESSNLNQDDNHNHSNSTPEPSISFSSSSLKNQHHHILNKHKNLTNNNGCTTIKLPSSSSCLGNKRKSYDDQKIDIATTTECLKSSPHFILAPVTVHRHMEAS